MGDHVVAAGSAGLHKPTSSSSSSSSSITAQWCHREVGNRRQPKSRSPHRRTVDFLFVTSDQRGPDEEACCFSSTRPVCSTRGYCAAMAVTPPDHLDDASDVDFDVQRSWVGNVIVLTVRGDLDALSAPHLAAAINRGLSGESTAVVVDLSELEFLAASGMSVLLTGHTAAGSSKRFAVVADGPATSRPMTLLGLDRQLDLFPTLDAALNDITQHSDA